jgi:hypothetical protein
MTGDRRRIAFPILRGDVVERAGTATVNTLAWASPAARFLGRQERANAAGRTDQDQQSRVRRRFFVRRRCEKFDQDQCNVSTFVELDTNSVAESPVVPDRIRTIARSPMAKRQ